MKTPTLVLAAILVMAVAGDSANMDKLLRQLRLLAATVDGEKWDADTEQNYEGDEEDAYANQNYKLVETRQQDSSSEEPLRACENQTLNISCPAGRQINITSALYGRNSLDVCIDHLFVFNTDCESPNSLDKVKTSCQGKSSCSVRASNTVFGVDPCDDTFKYLEVNSTCIDQQGAVTQQGTTAAPGQNLMASTSCTNYYMELSIPVNELTNIKVSELYWGTDQNCGAINNGSHYNLRTELYDCGTQVSFDPTYVIFLNTINILSTHQQTGGITRDGGGIMITSKCKYERQEWVHATFLPILGGLNFTEVGFGQLEVRLSIFPDSQYQSPYPASQYPIHFKLRQRVYMQLEVQGHEQNLAVLALNCKATLSPDPNDDLQYQLISDGCSSDITLTINEDNDVNDHSKERFSFEAFRFVEQLTTVYVHCEVLVCDAADSGSRCAQGCVERRKRAAGEQVNMRGRHMIYQGPIILDGDKEAGNALSVVNDHETTTPGRRSAPWTVLAAGGALMALALVVMGAAMLRKRSHREKWAYQGLPNMEDDGE